MLFNKFKAGRKRVLARRASEAYRTLAELDDETLRLVVRPEDIPKMRENCDNGSKTYDRLFRSPAICLGRLTYIRHHYKMATEVLEHIKRINSR